MYSHAEGNGRSTYVMISIILILVTYCRPWGQDKKVNLKPDNKRQSKAQWVSFHNKILIHNSLEYETQPHTVVRPKQVLLPDSFQFDLWRKLCSRYSTALSNPEFMRSKQSNWSIRPKNKKQPRLASILTVVLMPKKGQLISLTIFIVMYMLSSEMNSNNRDSLE